jgi:hypothetical protein
MNLLRDLFFNAAATHQLQVRYYLLTTFVGLCGVAVGIAIMLTTVYMLAPMFVSRPSSPRTGNWRACCGYSVSFF